MTLHNAALRREEFEPEEAPVRSLAVWAVPVTARVPKKPRQSEELTATAHKLIAACEEHQGGTYLHELHELLREENLDAETGLAVVRYLFLRSPHALHARDSFLWAIKNSAAFIADVKAGFDQDFTRFKKLLDYLTLLRANPKLLAHIFRMLEAAPQRKAETAESTIGKPINSDETEAELKAKAMEYLSRLYGEGHNTRFVAMDENHPYAAQGDLEKLESLCEAVLQGILATEKQKIFVALGYDRPVYTMQKPKPFTPDMLRDDYRPTVTEPEPEDAVLEIYHFLWNLEARGKDDFAAVIADAEEMAAHSPKTFTTRVVPALRELLSDDPMLRDRTAAITECLMRQNLVILEHGGLEALADLECDIRPYAGHQDYAVIAHRLLLAINSRIENGLPTPGLIRRCEMLEALLPISRDLHAEIARRRANGARGFMIDLLKVQRDILDLGVRLPGLVREAERDWAGHQRAVSLVLLDIAAGREGRRYQAPPRLEGPPKGMALSMLVDTAASTGWFLTQIITFGAAGGIRDKVYRPLSDWRADRRATRELKARLDAPK